MTRTGPGSNPIDSTLEACCEAVATVFGRARPRRSPCIDSTPVSPFAGPGPTVLPGIVLVGSMRCGSSSVFRHLSAHPSVHGSQRKETYFFDQHYGRGWAWYEEVLGRPGAGQTVFEATPSYLGDERAIRRLAADLPDASLIVCLRDPVERAHSHYWMNVATRKEPLDLDSALDAEQRGDVELDPTGPGRRYLRCGLYGPQLRHLLSVVPREQVNVVFFEDYVTDPIAEMTALIDALGLPPAPGLPAPGAVNRYQRFRSVSLRYRAKRLPPPLRRLIGRVNRVPDSYPELSDRTRERLTGLFVDSTAELAELLDADLGRIWPSAR